MSHLDALGTRATAATAGGAGNAATPHELAKMREIAVKAEQLPLLPTIVLRVLRLDPLSERYFEDLLGLAEEDPTFAVRLIRLANAPTSAPAKPIVTIRLAVIRLGARECAGLVTALAVSRIFVPRTVAHRHLWLHALQTAVAARTIAAMRPSAAIAPDQAYLAGLLHDIGRFIMFDGATGDLERVDETHWHSPQQLLDAEQHVLGYDHVQLGGVVCQRWSIPSAITEVVKLHHDYTAPKAHAGTPLGPLLAVVQMADLLSARMMNAPEMADLDPNELNKELLLHCSRPEWSHAPVAPSVLAPRVAAIRNEAAEMANRLLDLPAGSSRP